MYPRLTQYLNMNMLKNCVTDSTTKMISRMLKKAGAFPTSRNRIPYHKNHGVPHTTTPVFSINTPLLSVWLSQGEYLDHPQNRVEDFGEESLGKRR